jgi:hypothetical protein
MRRGTMRRCHLRRRAPSEATSDTGRYVRSELAFISVPAEQLGVSGKELRSCSGHLLWAVRSGEVPAAVAGVEGAVECRDQRRGGPSSCRC